MSGDLFGSCINGNPCPKSFYLQIIKIKHILNLQKIYLIILSLVFQQILLIMFLLILKKLFMEVYLIVEELNNTHLCIF